VGPGAAALVRRHARVRDRVLKWGLAGLFAAAIIIAAALALRRPPGTPGAEPPAGSPAAPSDPGAPPSDRDAGAGARAPDLAASPELELMTRLRAVVDTDPAAALNIADEGERRFRDGALADERHFLEMRALVHLNRIVDARDRAREFYVRFPTSPWAERVFRLTGLHPTPVPGP